MDINSNSAPWKHDPLMTNKENDMLKSLTTRNQNPITGWQKEMNRLFEKFNRDLDLGRSDLDSFEPRVEVKEKGKEYIVRAEIPGMEEKDLHVTLKDNCLILEGERKSEQEKEEKGFYQSEFSYGSFYRAIPLDEEVNPDAVNASYKHGILSVRLVKTGAGKNGARNIPITLS